MTERPETKESTARIVATCVVAVLVGFALLIAVSGSLDPIGWLPGWSMIR